MIQVRNSDLWKEKKGGEGRRRGEGRGGKGRKGRINESKIKYIFLLLIDLTSNSSK